MVFPTVGYVVLIAMWMFRAPIKDMLGTFSNVGNRAKKFQYKGLSINFGDSLPISSENAQDSSNAKYLQLLKACQSPVISWEEEIISKQLNDRKVDGEQAVNALIHDVANKNLLIRLLTIDKCIFKEQIELLMSLNSSVKPLTKAELIPFYNKWKENKDKHNFEQKIEYPFEKFINFFTETNLIYLDIHGYKIAPIGKEYLLFLVKTGREI